MDDSPLDDPIADTLLEGRLGSDEAPPELRAAALLVQAARGPAAAADEVCEPELLASLVAAHGAANVVEGRFGRRRGRALPPKVAAAAAVFALLGGGVAAAATGSLPGPIQSRVAAALAHVGMSVPRPGHTGSEPSPSTSVHAHGAGATRPAAYVTGLCTAYAASQQRVGGTTARSTVPAPSSAVARLEAAAGAHGETVAQYCATVSTSTTIAHRRGRPATTGGHPPSSRRSGPPSSVPHGPPSSVPNGPPVSTPTGPPGSVPHGPPLTTPTGPPTSTPHGPPVTTPTGPPTSTPQGPPVTTPATSPHASGAN